MSSSCVDAEVFYLDDMEDEVILTEMVLKRQNFELDIRFFVDENDLRAALRQRVDEGSALPGLVVTDLNMPGKGGVHLVSTLREDAAYRDVVIGLCTGSDNPADRAASLAAGADFFAVKPFNGDVLAQICEITGRFRLIEQDDGRHLYATEARSGAA